MSALRIFLTALQHCFLTACIALFDLGADSGEGEH